MDSSSSMTRKRELSYLFNVWYNMSGILLDRGARNKPTVQQDNNTIEKDILRRVIKESWRGKMSDSEKGNTQVLAVLDDHAFKMGKLLETLDYEILCMPNIIANSKHMSKNELIAYLAFLEAIATGYKYRYDNDFINIFMAGLTLKVRDLRSISKYFNYFVSRLEARLDYYRLKAEKEGANLKALTQQLAREEAGVLRIFKRGKIHLMRIVVSGKSRRVERLNKHTSRYNRMLVHVKGVTAAR